MGFMNKKVVWFSYPVFNPLSMPHDKYADEAHKFFNRVAALGFGYVMYETAFGNKRFSKGIVMFDGGEFVSLDKKAPPDSWQRFFRFRPFHHGWFGFDIPEGACVELRNYKGPTSATTPQNFFEQNNFFQVFAQSEDDIVIFSGFDQVPKRKIDDVELVVNPRLQTWRREPPQMVKKLPKGKTQRLFSWKKASDYDYKLWPSKIKRALGKKKDEPTEK